MLTTLIPRKSGKSDMLFCRVIESPVGKYKYVGEVRADFTPMTEEEFKYEIEKGITSLYKREIKLLLSPLPNL